MTMPWDRPAHPAASQPQPLSLIDGLTQQHELSWARTPDSGSLTPEIAALVDEAAARFDRFSPWVAEHFPETGNGVIESEIQHVPGTQDYVARLMERDLPGELWVKRDDCLPISGSIKSRGGVHEVFRLAEEGHYDKLSVASTGNLALSIGTVGPLLGFETEVHMSADAKQWKKDLLRARGATVIEHSDLFTDTVAEARESAADAFFIDDENSIGLFTGYAVAGQRLKAQFDAVGKRFSEEDPLYVYLPCGVGGGPGGVTFGLKMAFGDAVSCHFVEPTASPCMTLGVLTGNPAVSCADYGLPGRTVADGLAVQSPSPLALEHAAPLVSGFHTVEDVTFLAAVNWLERSADIIAEPSATAGLTIPWRLPDVPDTATHLVWLTGGSLIPDQDKDRLRGQAATASLHWQR